MSREVVKASGLWVRCPLMNDDCGADAHLDDFQERVDGGWSAWLRCKKGHVFWISQRSMTDDIGEER